MPIVPKAIHRFSAIPIKIPVVLFTEIEQQQKKHPKICMKLKQTPKSQSNMEKEEQSWRYHSSWFQIILQSYSNQNSMVLAKNQTYSSMEPNRKPRNKPMHIWSINLWQRSQEYTMEKDSPLNKLCWENWMVTWKNNETTPLSTTCTKINSKWIKDLNVRPETIKLPE